MSVFGTIGKSVKEAAKSLTGLDKAKIAAKALTGVGVCGGIFEVIVSAVEAKRAGK